jgi:hypothetical protein
MAKFTVYVLLSMISLTLHAQVYRCDGPGGPVYSQMPCSEDAERLPDFEPVEDPGAQSGEDKGPEDGVEAEPEPPSAMENFVATLHKQREQQIGELDHRIVRLENQLNREGDDALREDARNSVGAELLALKSERKSVADQYATLIAEAQSRAASPNDVN